MNQRLWTGEELLPCSYKTPVSRGVTIGIYDYAYYKERTLVDVEEFDAGKTFNKRIIINKELAEKYGFKIVIR